MDIVARALRANQELYRDVCRRSGGRVNDVGGVCLIHGRHPSWIIANGAFRTDPTIPPDAILRQVRASFVALARRPTIMTFGATDADLDAALEGTDWRPVLGLPILVRAEPLDPRPADRAALHRLEGTPADLELVRDLLRRGFAEDDEEAEVVDAAFASVEAIAPPDVVTVVAELAGVPTAVALVYRFGREAVVAWVATVPEARRQGLGRTVTAEATNAGLEMGVDLVTLQASAMGLPVYRALGYEDIETSRIWLGPKPR